ncbi:MAG TPA: PilZ domain-containing protein [Thermoanaerobaculia bacterium]|nr:PilZ domain-containing protein [Thermoanaerobaculia bacterium]
MVSSNRRESDRVVRRLPVRFWRVGEERSVTGYTTNISTTGMFVVTHQPLPKAARIRVEVLDPRSGFIVEAEVAHAHKVSLELSALGPSGMGVRFLPIETLVRELFPQAVGGLRGGRTGESPIVSPPAAPPAPAVAAAPAAPPKRAPTPGSFPSNRVPIVRVGEPVPEAAPVGKAPIAVRFSSIEQFLSIYERDLRQGGLFVSTSEPARIGDLMEIELHLPAPLLARVRLRARVVHRIDPQGGEGMGGPNLLAGIGVELLDRRGALAALEPYLSGTPPAS